MRRRLGAASLSTPHIDAHVVNFAWAMAKTPRTALGPVALGCLTSRDLVQVLWKLLQSGLSLWIRLHYSLHTATKSPKAKSHHLTTSPAHRLVREHSRHTSHNNIQRSADVNRHGRRRVSARRNASADNAHDSVETDGDTIAGAAVG